MNRPSTQSDRELIAQFDQLVRNAGGEPGELSGKLVREIMHTAVKLIRDQADTGELKLISRSLKELRYAMRVFRDYPDVRKVSIFGSARTDPGHRDYAAAEAFGRQMAQHGWMIITGAGGGIMRAAQGGAGRDRSFGVAIRLPFETTANEFIEGDHKLIVFRYFFTRKLMFASQAHAVALLPGGFGTQDEGYEILTLIQTGKTPIVPVVMIDPPGSPGSPGSPPSEYWQNWDRHLRSDLLGNGMIGADDLNLYYVTDDPDAAADHIMNFYRNYHSMRFVRDELVIRMHRPLTGAQVDALNDEFADLLVEGRIMPCGALSSERRHLDLPRLRFAFVRRAYGRLRLLIDRINEYDAQH